MGSFGPVAPHRGNRRRVDEACCHDHADPVHARRCAAAGDAAAGRRRLQRPKAAPPQSRGGTAFEPSGSVQLWRLSCTLSLALCASLLTSWAADVPSCLTVWAASVAVPLTDCTASCAGSLRLPATSLARDCASCAIGCAACFSCSAASRSLAVAGSRDDTSQPTPKAMTPAASGLPWALARTWLGAPE